MTDIGFIVDPVELGFDPAPPEAINDSRQAVSKALKPRTRLSSGSRRSFLCNCSILHIF